MNFFHPEPNLESDGSGALWGVLKLRKPRFLTFEGSTIEEINAVATRYRDAGVDRIVALRGDAREESALASKRGKCYENVPEFIAGLLDIHPHRLSLVYCLLETSIRLCHLHSNVEPMFRKS